MKTFRGGAAKKVAEIKTLTKAGVSLAKKKLAWVPLIFVLFKGKKNE